MVDVDPYRLSLSVTDANGRVTKWGYDSPDGRDIPQDMEITTSLPGGYKDLTTSLLREFRRSNPDTNLLDRVLAYGPGHETAFDGYFTQFPKRHGSKVSIEPGAVGWSGLLNFDTGFQMIYVDRDGSRWGAPPLSRKLLLAGAAQGQARLQATALRGGVVWDLPNEALAAAETAELEYDAGAGQTVASFGYKGARTGAFTNFEAPALFSADNEDLTGAVSGALTLDDTLRNLPITARRYLMLRVLTTLAQTPGLGWQQRFSALAAYGNHGLTIRAIDALTPGGIYNSDIVADVVKRTAPGLKFTTGPGGSIEPNFIVVPHMVFRAPTTGAEALGRASAFGFSALTLPEWGVYDDKKFFWRAPNPDRLCWKARISDGAVPNFEGEQIDDRFNGVIGTFTDPGGVQRVVGPPAAYWYGGTALADATDPTLVDTSPLNPVNSHGIPQKWAKLELSQPCTQAAAIALCAIFLQVQSQPQRRGQIEMTGLVGHPTINKSKPVWKIRAGDYIQLTDDGDDSDVKRRVISTRYTHGNRSNLVDVDNTPFTLDALLEMMAADLVGVVGGG